MQQIVIRCSKEKELNWQALLANKKINLFFVNNRSYPTDADLYIDAVYEIGDDFFEAISNKLVLVDAVLIPSSVLKNNQVRFNGWEGFYEKKGVEIAGSDSQMNFAKPILENLSIPYTVSADTPGMLAARAVAMIINEAFFGWGEGISSKADIDTAMKLGTNYPFGPFEWTSKIGIDNIIQLLTILSETDDRYAPAPALLSEASKISN
jgi:3-hydroxybutyryl-CoA dehydrogenase